MTFTILISLSALAILGAIFGLILLMRLDKISLKYLQLSICTLIAILVGIAAITLLLATNTNVTPEIEAELERGIVYAGYTLQEPECGLYEKPCMVLENILDISSVISILFVLFLLVISLLGSRKPRQ